MQNIEGHLAFKEQLERDGIMFAAGPNWTDGERSWEGDGMKAKMLRLVDFMEVQKLHHDCRSVREIARQLDMDRKNLCLDTFASSATSSMFG